jgi:2-phospho-L-lactate/phosphoenolpyruvate guanylyltransferase
MTAIVIPFRGDGPKRRLGVDEPARSALAHAMLGDVLAACGPVGSVTVVTDDDAARELAAAIGARVVGDPGGGQGPAVAAGLAGLEPGALLVVNADLPCATPRDVRALLRATPAGGMALVAAADGTTNALGLPAAEVFAPLYGAGSAARFLAHGRRLGLAAVSASVPNLADDVDTHADLDRVALRAGPRTQTALAALGLAA